jgi:thymidylate synthase (FAD)
MILIKPSAKIVSDISGMEILKHIERTGRVCYKSEDKITDESCIKFVKGIIQRKHESVLEHVAVTVKFICDRGVSHELVRHRIASFSQESTRYCNYSGGVTFIIPPWVKINPGEYTAEDIREMTCPDEPDLEWGEHLWFWSCINSENFYNELIRESWSPQQARDVLINSVKTEVDMTANLREWRHFFKLRAVGEAGKPHPQMVEITIPLLEEFKQKIPIIFDDILVPLQC